MRDKGSATRDILPEDFGTLEELWEFWDTRSSADYEDDMEPIEVEAGVRPRMTAIIQNVTVTDDTLMVDLVDGRTISAPLAWYPRLLHSQPEERSHWRLIGNGEGIHWPDLDEDISAEDILFGQPSGESQRSFSR